jgi:hypothetical protein
MLRCSDGPRITRAALAANEALRKASRPSRLACQRFELELLFYKGNGKEIEEVRPVKVADVSGIFENLQNTVLVFGNNALQGREKHVIFLTHQIKRRHCNFLFLKVVE